MSVTVFYERFRKVSPQCNTVVHVKGSVCDWPFLCIEEKESTVCYCWEIQECNET